MTARQRTERDLAACVQVLAAVHEQDGYPSRWPADAPSWLSPTGLVGAWIAETDHGVCGHIALVGGVHDPQLRAAVDAPASDIVAVSRLFVDSAVRGRRVGELLLRTATTFATGHELQLVLDVVDSRRSAAIALYERLGWRLVGYRTAGWTTPDGVRPRLRLYALPSDAPRNE
ncbi:MAG: GNAT family N-acetyltransferase [Mycobacterium sp.]|nr:GNAT family N-acetyltransferase [Mycobacterium sp.]